MSAVQEAGSRDWPGIFCARCVIEALPPRRFFSQLGSVNPMPPFDRTGFRCGLRYKVRGMTASAFFLAILGWSTLVLAFSPALTLGARIFLLPAWVIGLPLVYLYLGHRRSGWAALAAGTIVVNVVHYSLSPAGEHDWSADQEHMPRAVFADGSVRLENFRSARYRSTSDYEVWWGARSFKLDQLERLDFVHEILPPLGLIAHTFLSFGFADGRQVVISAEIRKKEGDRFSPLRGLFRNYELMYVVGEENDLIGLRTDMRGNPVYLYPARADPEQIRELFLHMLERANRLAESPEFYNTLTRNCTTSIVRHINEIAETPLRLDWRIVFPGYVDRLAWDLELLEIEGNPAETRERYRIHSRSAFVDESPRDWSRRIRERERYR